MKKEKNLHYWRGGSVFEFPVKGEEFWWSDILDGQSYRSFKTPLTFLFWFPQPQLELAMDSSIRETTEHFGVLLERFTYSEKSLAGCLKYFSSYVPLPKDSTSRKKTNLNAELMESRHRFWEDVNTKLLTFYQYRAHWQARKANYGLCDNNVFSRSLDGTCVTRKSLGVVWGYSHMGTATTVSSFFCPISAHCG